MNSREYFKNSGWRDKDIYATQEYEEGWYDKYIDKNAKNPYGRGSLCYHCWEIGKEECFMEIKKGEKRDI